MPNTPPAPPTDPVVVRSRFNRILAVVSWSLVALLAAGVLLVPGAVEFVNTLPLLGYVAVMLYLVLWRTRVEVDADGAVLHNVTRTIRVPWAALIDVDTKYAMTLVTPSGRYGAWSAPAPGAMAAFRATRDQRRGAGRTVGAAQVRPGDLAGTDSGRAAAAVRERWRAELDAGTVPVGEADAHRASVRVNGVALAILIGGAALAYAGLALLAPG